MANDWIKMRMNLPDDPAVIGIASRTKLSPLDVVARLYVLWCWADEQADDGFLPNVTPAFLDAKVKRAGFAEAMAAKGVEWLIIEPDGIRFPNFDRHNGASAKKRALETEKKRRQREEASRRSRDIVPETSGHSGDNCGTREEERERREEKNREDNTDKTVGQIGFAAAPSTPVKKERPAPALTDAQWLSALKADPTYSHVNIDHEHGKMIRWCEQKRKHPTRLRFLNWIGRIEKPLSGYTALMR